MLFVLFDPNLYQCFVFLHFKKGRVSSGENVELVFLIQDVKGESLNGICVSRTMKFSSCLFVQIHDRERGIGKHERGIGKRGR